MTPRQKQLMWVLALVLAVVIADQIAKAVIVREIERPVPYRDGTFFYITHERNPGLVGGHFADNRLVATTAPFVAVGVLAYLFRHLNAHSKVQTLAFGLVAGGAIGNLIDRLFRGEVVDFLQVHFYFVPFDFPWRFWPAFNIADIAICCGVFLLIVTWRQLSHIEEAHAINSV
ncbi:MAG: signal peptidase II [Candidatus Hydrogenedentes bacterium]|nr:signal peptidase II [Candidatus Hydrogenedentota bacterium]